MQKCIKLHFIDGCSEDSTYKNFLPQGYVLDSINPDFIFYDIFGKAEHIKYDCIRIFCTGENVRPDFNFCDYAISFDYLEFEDRHLRYPLYLNTTSFRQICDNERDKTYSFGEEALNRKFCSFVVSNSKADSLREEFFNALSEYKRVDSGGRYKNNIGAPINDKHKFLSQYKFNIAFENSATHGYITEKIFDAKVAGSIPIYWGDSTISKPLYNLGGGLNEKAFINISSFKNIYEAIEFIKYLDSNNEAYLKMLNAPLLQDKNHDKIFDERLKNFFDHIFSQNKEQAYRRGFGQWRLNIEKRYKKFQHTRNIIIKLTNIWRFLILKIPQK